MCIVARKKGEQVPYANEPEIRALSWAEMQQIAKRFESLNCYDRTKVLGSMLNSEKVNFQDDKQTELFEYAMSARRYALSVRCKWAKPAAD
jgi:hypothetical protein